MTRLLNFCVLVIKACTCSLLFCYSSPNASALEFHVEGRIDHESFVGDSHADETNSENFSLDVKDKRFLLILKKDSGRQISSLGCDGTDLYFIPYGADRPGTNAAATGYVQSAGFPGVVSILPQVIPTPVQVLWLTFQGKSFCNSSNDAVHLPFTFINSEFDINPNSTELTYDLFDSTDMPWLRRLKIYSPGYYLKWGIREPYKGPYNQGPLMAEYSLIDSNLVGGLVLPAKFDFSVFAKLPDETAATNRDDVTLTKKFVFSITNSSPACQATNFLPSIRSKNFSVIDFRFRDPAGGYVTYPAQDKRWITKANPRFARILHGQTKKQTPPKVAFVKYLIVGLTLVFGMFIAFAVAKKTDKQPS